LQGRGGAELDLDGDGRGAGRREGVAEPAARAAVSDRVPGRDPREDARLGARPDPGGLPGARAHAGGCEGAARALGGRGRRGEVLAQRAHGAEEPRASRHADRLDRRARRLPRGERERVPEDAGAAVHRAHGAGLAALRVLEGAQGRRTRLADDLPGADPGGGGGRARRVRRALGAALPDDRAKMADELAQHHAVLRLPARDPEGDVHDERDRGDERPAAEGDQEARRVPEPRGRAEGALPRDHEGERALDPARARLERRAEPLRAGVPGPRAGVTKRPFTQEIVQALNGPWSPDRYVTGANGNQRIPLGPQLPTHFLTPAISVRMPGGVGIAARGEYRGGHVRFVNPVAVG